MATRIRTSTHCAIGFNSELCITAIQRMRVTEAGCGQLAITAFQEGIFGRGIVMDFPRLRGVDWLENGTPITSDWLEEWEVANNIKIGSGDIVLIRTGRWMRRATLGPWNLAADSAGLHASSVSWFKG